MSTRLRQLLAVAHPAAFAAGYVLLSFANLPTPASGLWRPLAIAIVGALLLSLLLGLITRNRALGALLATATVLTLSATWLLGAVGAIAVLWILLVTVLRRARKAATLRWPGMDAASRLVGVFGAMFAVVAVISAAPAAVQSVEFRIPDTGPAATAEDRPDIFILLLDGYPSPNVLRTYLAFDNSAFHTALIDAGFDVATESRSNYTATWATLASMLNGQYLDQIPSLNPYPTDQAEQYVRLMRAINQGTALAELHGQGYQVVTAPSAFEAAAINSADQVLSGGQLTFFELSLLQHSPLLGVILAVAPDFVLDQQRQRIEHALDATVEVAGQTNEDPTFMFTHILNPHPPIVFTADGGLAELPGCFPTTCTLWEMHESSQWEGVAAQVEHLNELIVATVDQIVTADPDAVVVVMSDHGSRPPGAPEEALLQNLLAVRSPGHPALVSPDAHLVDLFAAIFDAYFGSQSPRHEYRGWINLPEFPLEMVEVRPSP